ncbi:MAG: TAXI family TRAP transporter solute-binding subunit [Synergistaceae bacterium]|nr:TAXI family TRAP transporter solute-binding subunit [Synergistaceae bacterium]
MKSSRFFKAMLILSAVLVLASSASAAEPDKTGWPSQLRFMAGPPGGNWFALGTALSEMWTGAGLPQTTSSSGGGVSNILNAHTRRGDLGFSVTSLLGAALKGEADFKGRVVDNAVIMSNLYTQYTYFIMRKDFAEKNGIKSVEDIIAKKLPMRFATLKPGTSSEFVVKALFDKGYGFDYKKTFQEWGGSVEYASYEGGADLLADNHLDCFAFSVGKIASVVMNIESQLDIVLLPVGQDALDKLSEAYGTVTLTIDPGIYKSVPEGAEPVKVVGDYTCIVIRKDLPASLVYELNKAIWEHKDAMVAAVKDMAELEPSIAIPATVPAHEGSVKFWSTLR